IPTRLPEPAAGASRRSGDFEPPLAAFAFAAGLAGAGFSLIAPLAAVSGGGVSGLVVPRYGAGGAAGNGAEYGAGSRGALGASRGKAQEGQTKSVFPIFSSATGSFVWHFGQVSSIIGRSRDDGE